MKKILCLCFILCLSLSGCQASRVPGLDWNSEEMVELQVFTGGVPAAAQRKITRDTEDIRRVAQALFSLEAARDAVNEDVPCGGIGTYFVFRRADGSQEVVLLGSGRAFTSCGKSFPLTRTPCGTPWKGRRNGWERTACRKLAASRRPTSPENAKGQPGDCLAVLF